MQASRKPCRKGLLEPGVPGGGSSGAPASTIACMQAVHGTTEQPLLIRCSNLI